MFIIFLLFAPSQTYAAGTTMSLGNLLKVCTTADMNWINFCNGYMQAVNDYGAKLGVICAPVGTSRTDLVRTLERNAQSLASANVDSVDAFYGAAALIERSYPCK